MGKYDDNVWAINKNTGEEVPKDIIESILREDYYAYIRELKSRPLIELSLEELCDLRKIYKMKNTVELKHEKYYITPFNIEKRVVELDMDTRGFIYTISFSITHSGWIKYKNNTPIPNYEALRKYYRVGDRVWRRIKADIDKMDIVRKITIKDKTYLIVNPLYSSVSNEITEIKFIAFADIWKNHLSELDYIYLCRLYGLTI